MLKVAAGSLAASIVALLFNFASSILYARLLGPEMRGEFGGIVFTVTLISSLSQFGFGQSYIYCRRKVYATSGMLAFLTISIVVITMVSLGMTAAFHVVDYDGPNIIVYLAAVTSAMLLFFTDISRLQPGLVVYNLKQITLSTGTVVLILVCLFFGDHFTTFTAVSIFFSSMLLTSVVVTPFVWKNEVNKKPFDTNIDWRYIYSYGLKSYGTSITGLLVNNFDRIFLLYMGGSLNFGIYIVAYNTSRLIGIIPQTLSNVIFARYAGVDEQGLAKTTGRVFSLLFIPMMMLALVVSLAGTFLIPVLFGSDFSGAIIPFGILIFECVISGLGWILAQRFAASGRPGLVFFRQLVSIFPLFLLFVYLPPYNIGIVLALMLLVATTIRFLLTIFMFPAVYNEPIPSLLPQRNDIAMLVNFARRRVFGSRR